MQASGVSAARHEAAGLVCFVFSTDARESGALSRCLNST